MSLSGSFYTNVGSHNRLQIEWSATQNISTNQSTITARLYWIALDQYGVVNSSATKDCGTTIDGTTATDSVAGKASLSAYQKKLIQVHSKTVTHNVDGTKSVGISAYFDVELTLGGTYYGRINVSGTATLNTIPRESTLISSASWTAGGSLLVSISRDSTSFTHDLVIKVNGVTIKTVTGIGASTFVTFNATETENIFIELAKDTTNFDQATTLILTTKNGTSTIGSNTYSGTCYSPSPTSLSANNFNIGSSVPIDITESDSSFTHTITATLGSYTTTIITKTTSTSVTWDTSSIASNLYNQLPSSNSGATTLTCTTYYGVTQVRSPITKTITAIVTNSNPTFGTGYTYKDTNTAITAITGNDQYIVQNKSTVLVEILTSAKATAVNGASMSSYVATLNGISITQAYSSTATVSFNFGVINANTNLTLSIMAVDSRGNSTSTTKTVTMLSYSNPLLTINVARTNNFDAETILKVSGNISLLTVSGVNKNSIQTLQYRYKDSAIPTWGTWTNLTYTTSGSTFTATDVTLTLDSAKAFNFEVQSIDKFSTTTSAKTVPVGQPILFIDSTKKSVGINKFPTNNSTFEVSGAIDVTNGSILTRNPNNSNATVKLDWSSDTARIQYGGTGAGSAGGFQIQGSNGSARLTLSDAGKVTATRYATGADLNVGNGVGGGLELNNSDILGANAIWFIDPANVNYEGLNFLKSTATTGSTNIADHDNLKVLDGVIYLNDKTVSVIDSSGSNSNGEYIRYTSGIQICWVHMDVADQSISTAYGSLFQGIRTWTFPATFISIPSVSCSEFKWGTGASWGGTAGATTTSVTLRGWDTSSRASGTTVSISAIAIGRWK